jgi:hypothetical protein
MRGAKMNLPIKARKKRLERKRMIPILERKASGVGQALSSV